MLHKCYYYSFVPFFVFQLSICCFFTPSTRMTSCWPHPAATAHSKCSCTVALIGNGFSFSTEQSLICAPCIPISLGKPCLLPGNVRLKHASFPMAHPGQRNAGTVSPERREPCSETEVTETCLHSSPKPIAFIPTDQFQFLKSLQRIIGEAAWYPSGPI